VKRSNRSTEIWKITNRRKRYRKMCRIWKQWKN